MRINKYVSQSGVCSRREADGLISSGRVQINGVKAILGDQVFDEDIVTVNGKVINIHENELVYLVYNKPVGVICSSDKNAHDTIESTLQFKTRIFPVGRLDVGTSGLMILTNDGAIVNQLTKAENKVEKEYEVTTVEPFFDNAAETFENGIMIDGFKTLPAKFELLSEDKARITVIEGKNRLIRKLCEAAGSEVKTLKRVRIGKLNLNDLPKGKYYEVSKEKLGNLLGVEFKD